MRRVFLQAKIIAFIACAAGAEPIHLAAQKGDVEALKHLLDAGVAVDLPSTKDTTKPGISALILAVQWRRAGAVETLLAAGADPDFIPEGIRLAETPLMVAAKAGDLEVLDALLAAGADPNLKTAAGTPLHFARLVQRDEVARRLLAAGALPQIGARPVGARLAEADPDRGMRLAGKCAICHGDLADPEAKLAEAPALSGIVGAPKAAQPNVRYSEALAGLGGSWTIDELNSFLANPGAFVPGTTMWGVGIADERDRLDLIAYLGSLGDGTAPGNAR